MNILKNRIKMKDSYDSIFNKEAAKNKNGLISYEQLKKILKKCKIDCSEAELQDYINDIDFKITENGEIDKDGFNEIINKIEEKKDSEEDISEIFEMFDKNNKNLISPKDVLEIFSKIDENIKEEEVLQIFKECDLDQDGYLNLEEFSRMINNH